MVPVREKMARMSPDDPRAASTGGAQPPSPGTTAVLAGSGDLGTRVGLQLARDGFHVLGLRRNPARLPAELAGQAVDLRHQRPQLPADTSVVVVALTADAHTAEAYRETYVTGLDHVLAATGELAAPPRIVLVSSTAVHGVADGSWVDETTPAVPATATAAELRTAEERLHARRPDATALRLTGLYGSARNRLVDSVRDGTATISSTPVHTNRIHRDDASAAIVHLATRVAHPEPVYLGVDQESAERGAVLRFIADQLGVDHPPVVAPDSDRGHGKRCRGDKLRASGFVPTYPTYREGYGAILRQNR